MRGGQFGGPASRGIMGHTSDVLCGAGIVSRTFEIEARVATIIAAVENATGVTIGVCRSRSCSCCRKPRRN